MHVKASEFCTIRTKNDNWKEYMAQSMLNIEKLAEHIRPVEARLTNVEQLSDAVNAIWLTVDAVKDEQVWNFKEMLNMQAGLSIHRWKIWWAIPRLLANEKSTPPESYLILYQLKDANDDQPNYVLLLTTIDHNMGFSLAGSHSADVGLELHGHYNGAGGNIHPGFRHAVLLASSRDPYLLLESGVAAVKKRIRSHWSGSMSERLSELIAHANRMPPSMPRGPGPSFVDYLGWCTWDSFYTDLSERRVLEGLRSFVKTGVRPGFLILDDGWQSTDVDDRLNGHQWGGRLRSFLANYKFASDYVATSSDECSSNSNSSPLLKDGSDQQQSASCSSSATVDEGRIHGSIGRNLDDGGHSLSPLIRKAREEFGVHHTMVWHTLSGYWSGVSPTAPEMQAFSPELAFPRRPFTQSMLRMSGAATLEGEPFSRLGVGVVHQDRLEAFFSAYHSTLKAMGVSGVKVDAQSVLPVLQEMMGTNRSSGWELTLAAHAALQESIAASFGRHRHSIMPDEFPVVHCMCHSLHTLLAVAALYPDRLDGGGGQGVSRMRPVVRGSDDYWPKDAASHGPHLYANTMNSLLLSHVGLQDWDMFQSGHGRTSQMHAAARAISGGPVYVSDSPDSHDSKILQQLAFPDGTVPRCLRNAMPPRRTLFVDPQRTVGMPLILQNINAAGGGVVGLFSIAGAVLEDDKDSFRFLSPDEMQWPESMSVPDVSSGTGSKRTPGPIYDETNPSNEQYLSHMAVHTWASPVDVEEIRSSSSRRSSNAGMDPVTSLFAVALRHSDRSLHLCATATSRVSVSLPRVFDFDIVSFAPLQTLPHSTGTGTGTGMGPPGGPYVGVIGAASMYNAGGAVVGTNVVRRQGDRIVVESDLLGHGHYWMTVVQTADRLSISDVSVVGVVLDADGEEEGIELDETVDMDVGNSEDKGTTKRSQASELAVTLTVERKTDVQWADGADPLIQKGGSGSSREEVMVDLIDLLVPPTAQSTSVYTADKKPSVQRTRVTVSFVLV
eukprot:gene312-570_t